MIKQVLVLRKDLNMRKGKMIAQGAHAAIAAMFESKPNWLKEWKETGTTKIVVSVNSLDELADIYHAAQEADLPRSMIEDAGRTEFKEPTFTAVGIGPAPAELIDPITGTLPLL
jgi:peptidyl-tRNA hydrolase, PTH2 family